MLKNSFLIIFVVISINFFNVVYSQQTVFNVPSADVTEEKHLFLQQEAQFRGWQPSPFFVGTSYSAYGLGNNTEIDATLFNVGATATNTITLGTGFKSAMPIVGLKDKYPKREYKFTAGSQVLSSLEGQGVGNWSYSHLSGRVPRINTRLTGGISYGTKQVFGTNSTSFIGAIEQPIDKSPNSKIEKNISIEKINEIVEDLDRLQYHQYFDLFKEIRSEYLIMDYAITNLKVIAKKYGIVVFINSYLSRELEHRKQQHPKLTDLEAPKNLAKISDVVMMLYREKYYNPEVEEGEKNILQTLCVKPFYALERFIFDPLSLKIISRPNIDIF